MRERGLFLLGGELGFQLLRAVAHGCRGFLLLCKGGDLGFEIGPDGLQSFEVAPQTLDLAQLQLDLLLVGADDRVGIAQLAAQLIALGDGALQLRGQLERSGTQLIIRAPFDCQQARQLVDLLLEFLQCLVAAGQCGSEIELARGEHQ